MERDEVIFKLIAEEQHPRETTEQRPNHARILSLGESFHNNLAGNRLQSPENFSLSNYEDDDDDSGFCCPCCLPR
ncbi:hypothetical protein [Pedobacter antarcticus]|uniref:hypothetical protein n=1 Tax=Pedobacter antarcticus TaxID=34086 RepID=UPI00115FB735|nr:hypothetical protein [Pedobacter antarcticus]